MPNILDCIPIYDSDALLYQRNEDLGNLIFISKIHPEVKEIEINEIALFILGMSNGENNLSDIVEEILEKYNAEKDKVLYDTTKILIELWRLGVVKWENATPYDYLFKEKKENITIKMLTEDEVIKSEERIGEYYCSPLEHKELLYSIVSIKQKVYALREMFFVMENDGEIISRISFMLSNDVTIQIGSFYLVDELADYTLVIEFIHWCASKLLELMNQKEIKRFRIFIDIQKNKKILSQIQKIGFKQVGVLKNELGYNCSNIYLFDFKL